MTKKKSIRLIKKNAKQGTDAYTFEIIFEGDLKELSKHNLINEQGKRYGTVEINHGKATVVLILPKFIRENNIQPFTLIDSIYLDLIKDDCEQQLKKIFGTSNLESKIKAIEVNITKRVSGNANISDVLDLLSKALLLKEQDNLKYVGQSKKCRLKEEIHTVIIKRPHYYLVKAYDKTEQMRKLGIKVSDGLLRIEIIMIERTIERLFGSKTTFQDILTKDSLVSLLREYKRIFCYEIIEDKVKKYLNSCVILLLESLCDTESPIETIAVERDLIVDKEVLRKALRKWQRMRNVSDNSSRDVELYAKKYFLPEDVVLTLHDIKDSCG
ncbi:hypothetical protein [Sedimentibacter sp.]|uniref:hypothetical protein n=1 Tax=Sedimentibacter sp. TaxID=1960295 RepID=UPI0028ABD606|nr:hypothetical protein [Sedimentibacter sp.]